MLGDEFQIDDILKLYHIIYAIFNILCNLMFSSYFRKFEENLKFSARFLKLFEWFLVDFEKDFQVGHE